MFRRPRHFLAPEAEAWHAAVWERLIRRIGGQAAMAARPLVTPTRTFFPPTETTGPARVAYIFEQVKHHAGMSGWHCQLEPQPEAPPSELGELMVLRAEQPRAAGTFGLEENTPVITYDPAAAAEPHRLIAILAHELAHLLLAGWPEIAALDRLHQERATDLATVALGFGLFGANWSFNFQGFRNVMSQGWSVSRLGYLDEREWAYALANFLCITRRDTASVKPFLKPYLFDDVRNAAKILAAR